MGNEKTKRTLVLQWIEQAQHDIGIAETLVVHHSPYTDGICFHAQQAAEKALKALLVWFEIPFKKTHNLPYLAELLSDKISIPENMHEGLEQLEDYAVDIRYPEAMTDPSDEQALKALAIAKYVLGEAEKWLKKE